MKIKMKRSISGLYGHDGKTLPRYNECGDVEDTMARDLCDKGYAEKCECKPKAEKVERATAAPGEKRKGKPSK